MVYFLDTGVNLALNVAGFTGLGDPHQILIAVVLGTAAVLWNSTLLPRWVMTAFFVLMFMASAVARVPSSRLDVQRRTLREGQ